MQTDTGLYLNVAPLDFDDASVTVGSQPFQSKDQLRQLRLEHGKTHVFRREADEILSLSLSNGIEPLGSSHRTIRLSENLKLCAVLAREAILNHLHEISRPVYTYHPIRFLATGEKHNLVAASAPFGHETPDWLAVRPLYLADIRIFEFDARTPVLGVAIDVRTRRLVEATCDRLRDLGLALEGAYVGKRLPHDDERLESMFRLLGRVERVSEDSLLLGDTRDDTSSVNASEVFIEARWDTFYECLRLAFPNDFTSVRDKLEDQLAEMREGKRRLKSIENCLSYFRKQSLELREGCGLRFGELLSSDMPGFPPHQNAPATVFSFHGDRSSTHKLQGLKDNGPFSLQTFAKNRPRICVICQSRKKGMVDQFVHKFLYGIDQERSNAFPDGFLKRYHVDSPVVTYFTAVDDQATSYRTAAQNAIRDAQDNSERWDLALVQTDAVFRNRKSSDNPYLAVKRVFMTHQIPVQTFTGSTAALNNTRLSYALNNIGLQVYAKLNGIPWLIKFDRTVSHELVVGMGSASLSPSRLGDSQRFVGITTVFSSDGKYWVSNLTQSVPYENYTTTLVESLERTVTRVRDDMNWRPGDNIRLVFHAFKTLKESETTAVMQLMESLGDYSVEFAFLHMKETHPYLLLDASQPGVPVYGSSAMRGAMAPPRGKIMLFTEHEALLVLTGPRELKRVEDGIPHPVLLELHPASTFKDMTYLSRQAYAFSCHSWRTYAEASMPVTIYYSDLVANLLGKLSTLPQWDPDVMLGTIGRTRWFL